jgi:hypothetical protein
LVLTFKPVGPIAAWRPWRETLLGLPRDNRRVEDITGHAGVEAAAEVKRAGDGKGEQAHFLGGETQVAIDQDVAGNDDGAVVRLE